MPVKRLRSLQEAEDSLRRAPDDPQLWSSLADLWELSDRLSTRSFPPGLYKHRSIEDLNRQRDAWEAAAIEAITVAHGLGR